MLHPDTFNIFQFSCPIRARVGEALLWCNSLFFKESLVKHEKY